MSMNDYAPDREETRGGAPAASVIKDSGDRTMFESGAVRDMHEGKGRCDLLPMCVLLRLARHYEAGSKKYGDRNWEKGIPAHSFADSAMRHMFKYMDGQRDEDHLIAAIWNLCGLAWTEEKKPEMMDIPNRVDSSTTVTEEVPHVCGNCGFGRTDSAAKYRQCFSEPATVVKVHEADTCDRWIPKGVMPCGR